MHSVHNFQALLDGPDKATSHWFLMLYARRRQAGAADAPADPDRLHDRQTASSDGDGNWLLDAPQVRNWFEGGTPTTNPKLDDK